jgi:hypothetical protein
MIHSLGIVIRIFLRLNLLLRDFIITCWALAWIDTLRFNWVINKTLILQQLTHRQTPHHTTLWHHFLSIRYRQAKSYHLISELLMMKITTLKFMLKSERKRYNFPHTKWYHNLASRLVSVLLYLRGNCKYMLI